MSTLWLVRLSIVFLFIMMYATVFYMEQVDLQTRTDNILEEHSSKLRNNYKSVLQRIELLSQNTFSGIINQKEVHDLLKKAKETDSKALRKIYRDTLYKRIKPHFEKLQSMGVMMITFVHENNQAFLRLQRPEKFDDDITKKRFSFVHVNKNREVIYGFEAGKVCHAFRNVYPIFYENGEYLGSVDIAFSSDIFEISMMELYGTETHFIVHKDIFASREFKDDIHTYIPSIEHEDYLFSLGDYRKNYVFEESELKFNTKFKEKIALNIGHGEGFALSDEDFVAIYIPIKNMQDNRTVAYLISYSHDTYLRNVINSYIKVNIFTLISILLIFIVFYKNIKQTLFLRDLVDEKTRDLKFLNENLKQEVQTQNLMFETLFKKNPDGIAILKDGVFTQCNEAVLKILHMDSTDELIGKSPIDVSPEFQPDGMPSAEKALMMIDKSFEEGVHSFEWMHTRKSGDDFWAQIILTPITLNDEQMIHVIWRDISFEKHIQDELTEQKKELYHRANHDSLTGLPNRELFHDRLEQLVKFSQRHDKKFAVFFLDLDRFKHINDSLGHMIGDKVLKEVTQRFLSVMRQEDTLARLGGDEFTVLMQEIASIEDATIMANRIIDCLVAPLEIDGHILYTSTSIGISLYPNDATNSDELIMYADNAMYKAKDEGRNNYKYYSSEMTALVLGKVVMESNIRSSLENKDFEVYYQPQIDAITNKIVGIEALVRWNHPTLGFMSPAKFLPIAEETGLIIQLDKWVMVNAMKQVVSWYAKGLHPGVLALNLTMKLLNQKEFFSIMNDLITDSGIAHELVELEVTEGQIMDDPEKAISKLQAINQLGIKIAIDDFGTGYSSLSHLKRLPLDKLKIDKSFIDDIPQDEDDKAITTAIISLAKSLGLDVIAEGVETQEQKEFLIANGCKDIQGYLYSKPLCTEDMEKLLLEKKNEDSQSTHNFHI